MRAVGIATLIAIVGLSTAANGQAVGGFAQGMSEGLERGARIREAHARAWQMEEGRRQQKRAAQAGKLIAAGKCAEARTYALTSGDFALVGQVDAICAGRSVDAAPSSSAPAAATAEAEPTPLPAPASGSQPPTPQPSFTDCTGGGSYCATSTPGQPIRFKSCTTDTEGNKHCITD